MRQIISFTRRELENNEVSPCVYIVCEDCPISDYCAGGTGEEDLIAVILASGVVIETPENRIEFIKPVE